MHAPLTPEQSRTVAENVPLVWESLSNLRRRLPEHVDVRDLAQDGTLGLIKAVATFDPTKGCAFTSYAISCIHWAICDAMRRGARNYGRGFRKRRKDGRAEMRQWPADAPEEVFPTRNKDGTAAYEARDWWEAKKGSLRRDQADLLDQLFWQDLSGEDVARKEGVHRSTICRRLASVREALTD